MLLQKRLPEKLGIRRYPTDRFGGIRGRLNPADILVSIGRQPVKKAARKEMKKIFLTTIGPIFKKS